MSKEITKNMLLNMKLDEKIFVSEYVSYKRIIGGWEVRESWSDSNHDVTNSFFIPYNSVVSDPVEQKPKRYILNKNEDEIEAIQFLSNKRSVEDLKSMCKDAISFSDQGTGNICVAEIKTEYYTYHVNLNDYVINTGKGFFPMSPVLFNKLYKEN